MATTERSFGETDDLGELRDWLDDLGAGESITVSVEDHIDPLLVRYQLDSGRELVWEYTDENELSIEVGAKRGVNERLEFDVRGLRPQIRHEVLLDTFDDMEPGEEFVLVNDHDPKPLSYELRSTRGDVFEWEYRREGGDEWRVGIRKTAPSEPVDEDVLTRFDVREIPKTERHEIIHHRYGMIPDDETMELVAPHEPRPLRAEFRDRYGESFRWDVVEIEEDRCRVQVTKAASGEDQPKIIQTLDVREKPPARRHEQIFEQYDQLDGGEGFVLVNDHDPKPLYHQFDAEAGEAFYWSYRQRAPGEFRVLIGKTGEAQNATVADSAPTAGCGGHAGDETGGYDATLDVREIEGEPFGDIMAALEELGQGETLLLINSFEPVPLYDELSTRGFEHDTEQVGSQKFHVEITRR